jgi:hypothetical protein
MDTVITVVHDDDDDDDDPDRGGTIKDQKERRCRKNQEPRSMISFRCKARTGATHDEAREERSQITSCTDRIGRDVRST